MNLLPRSKRRKVPATVFAATLVALTVVLVAGCDSNPGGGQLATPTFDRLHIPDPFAVGAWPPGPRPPAEVLPTRGRGVRLYFFAPDRSTFSVSLRALDGTLTPLTENQGTPAPPEAGYFQVLSVDAKQNPAAYLMYVRAPLMLADPANFDILVVNRSLRTDVADSAPMVVSLRQRKVFKITVSVQGNGKVTSTPSGIQCGSAPSGAALTDCSRDFGQEVMVRLAANSNDLNTTKFIGWSGNCAPNVQVCEFTLDGTAEVRATAHFGATNIPVSPSNCTAAPVLPGLKWIGRPDCAFGLRDEHPGIAVLCDAKGYFCCEPGPSSSNAPRCGGQGRIQSEADCRHLGIEAILRQPGGCYEVN